MVVWPADLARGGRAHCPSPGDLDPDLAHQLTRSDWQGTANRLSRDEPVRWEVIDEVAVATRKPAGGVQGLDTLETPVLESAPWEELRPACPPQGSGEVAEPHFLERNGRPDAEGPVAGQIILQRRSLLACDGRTRIPAERFYAMLARVMPRSDRPTSRRPMPWDALAWEPTVHLGLFVHRVDGIAPGLYFLVRDPAKLDRL